MSEDEGVRGRGNLERRKEICKENRYCTICPLNGGENSKHRGKRGAQKPRSRRRRNRNG